jgi:hypothetical protein
MKLKIRFSHKYPKLYNQSSARLTEVQITTVARMHKDFLDYDTMYFEDGKTEPSFYPLQRGSIMLVLYFIGDKGIPFTTIRTATSTKQRYYQESIGKEFLLDFGEKKIKEQVSIFDSIPEVLIPSQVTPTAAGNPT